jgi:hypothetical protein
MQKRRKMRRVVFLGVALFTFLLGTMLGAVHSLILDSVDEAPKIQAFIPPCTTRYSLTPLRIGVFIGVDGATLSANGEKFAPYKAYEDRETIFLISPADLSDLARQLMSAGLFEEAEFNAPAVMSLPQAYTIILAWPEEVRQFTWFSGEECKVPEKYLKILETLNRNHDISLIGKFIAHNRR